MKLDTTGLQSFPSQIQTLDAIPGDFSAPPSFDLPNSTDVSPYFIISFNLNFPLPSSLQIGCNLFMHVTFNGKIFNFLDILRWRESSAFLIRTFWFFSSSLPIGGR